MRITPLPTTTVHSSFLNKPLLKQTVKLNDTFSKASGTKATGLHSARFGIGLGLDEEGQIMLQAHDLYEKVKNDPELVPPQYKAMMPPLKNFQRSVLAQSTPPFFQPVGMYAKVPFFGDKSAVVINPAMFTDEGPLNPESLEAYVAYYTAEAVQDMHRLHLLATRPEQHLQILQDSIKDQIRHGEQSPLIYLSKHVVPDPRFRQEVNITDHDLVKAVTDWLIEEPISKQAEYFQTGLTTLKPGARQKAVATFPKAVSQQLKTLLGTDKKVGDTIEALAMHYFSGLNRSYSQGLMVPQLPQAFRQAIAPTLIQIGSDTRANKDDLWSCNPEFNDTTQHTIRALCDLPQAASFLQQYPSRQVAESDLLNYAMSIHRRLSAVSQLQKHPFQTGLMADLKTVPLQGELEAKAIESTRLFANKFFGDALYQRSPFDVANRGHAAYTLARQLLGQWDRQVRRAVTQYHLRQFETNKAGHLSIPFENDLKLYNALDGLSELWPKLEQAPKAPFQHTNKTVDYQAAAPGDAGIIRPQNPQMGPLIIERMNQMMHETFRRLDLPSLLTNSPENAALISRFNDLKSTITATIPFCSEEVSQTFEPLRHVLLHKPSAN